jgi:hypothetical protein
LRLLKKIQRSTQKVIPTRVELMMKATPWLLGKQGGGNQILMVKKGDADKDEGNHSGGGLGGSE